MSSDSWKEESAYSYLDGEERREVWAWEFLRRLPAYRAAWGVFLKQSTANADFVSYDPPQLEKESKNSWLMRCDELGVRPRTLSYKDFCGFPWHLQEIIDPLAFFEAGVIFLPKPLIPAVLNFPDEIERYKQVLEKEDWDVGIVDPDYCIIVFDLRASWNSQLEKAKTAFEKKRKAKTSANYERPHEDHGKRVWRRHLRVLDAYYAGADNPTIGKYLKDGAITSEDASAGDDFISLALNMAASYRKILFTFVPKPE